MAFKGTETEIQAALASVERIKALITLESETYAEYQKRLFAAVNQLAFLCSTE